jgi:hypothetical protein
MSRWDYLTLAYDLARHAVAVGRDGPFTEGALLDLWDRHCSNELEIIGAESHEDVHAGEMHLVGLGHALREFTRAGYLVRDTNGDYWIADRSPPDGRHSRWSGLGATSLAYRPDPDVFDAGLD